MDNQSDNNVETTPLKKVISFCRDLVIGTFELMTVVLLVIITLSFASMFGWAFGILGFLVGGAIGLAIGILTTGVIYVLISINDRLGDIKELLADKK